MKGVKTVFGMHQYRVPSESAQTLTQGINGMVKRGKTNHHGFETMDADKLKEIASLGGKAVHARGTARVWDSESARAAGRKGLESQRNKRRNGTC